MSKRTLKYIFKINTHTPHDSGGTKRLLTTVTDLRLSVYKIFNSPPIRYRGWGSRNQSKRVEKLSQKVIQGIKVWDHRKTFGKVQCPVRESVCRCPWCWNLIPLNTVVLLLLTVDRSCDLTSTLFFKTTNPLPNKSYPELNHFKTFSCRRADQFNFPDFVVLKNFKTEGI